MPQHPSQKRTTRFCKKQLAFLSQVPLKGAPYLYKGNVDRQDQGSDVGGLIPSVPGARR